jgi:hypothetical protein
MEFQIEGADFDNIEEAKLAESGTYKLALTRKEIKPNRAEDGTNFEFDLMVVDDPSCEGITFTLYRALPKPGDEDKNTKRGQTFKDFKLTMLQETAIKLGGSVSGASVNIPEEALVQAVIEKKFNQDGRAFNILQEETIKPLESTRLELS